MVHSSATARQDAITGIGPFPTVPEFEMVLSNLFLFSFVHGKPYVLWDAAQLKLQASGAGAMIKDGKGEEA